MNTAFTEAWADITVRNEIIRTHSGRIRCARHQLGRTLSANGERHITLMKAFGGYWTFPDRQGGQRG